MKKVEKCCCWSGGKNGGCFCCCRVNASFFFFFRLLIYWKLEEVSFENEELVLCRRQTGCAEPCLTLRTSHF